MNKYTAHNKHTVYEGLRRLGWSPIAALECARTYISEEYEVIAVKRDYPNDEVYVKTEDVNDPQIEWCDIVREYDYMGGAA